MTGEWWTIYEGLNIPPEAFVPNGAEIERKNIERIFRRKGMKIYIHSGETHIDINNLQWPENITWVSDYPESTMSESELVKYVFYTLESISPMYNMLFKTTSSIFFDAIRVAIKEGLVQNGDVHVTYIDKDGDIFHPFLDKDGRYIHNPESMFNTHRMLLRRLM